MKTPFRNNQVILRDQYDFEQVEDIIDRITLVHENTKAERKEDSQAVLGTEKITFL